MRIAAILLAMEPVLAYFSDAGRVTLHKRKMQVVFNLVRFLCWEFTGMCGLVVSGRGQAGADLRDAVEAARIATLEAVYNQPPEFLCQPLSRVRTELGEIVAESERLRVAKKGFGYVFTLMSDHPTAVE